MGFTVVKDASGKRAPLAPYVPPVSFSEEQEAIIRCPAPVVVGQAFAGTGKSTTGLGYAQRHPDKRILVVCFNTANALEGRHKYPSVSRKVDVQTTHALARRRLTPMQSARVPQHWSAVTLRGDLLAVGGKRDYRTAAIVASMLTEFFMSVDDKIDPAIHGRDARMRLRASESALEECARYAQRLWYAMNTDQKIPGMATEVNAVSIPHDAYLKMFVMTTGNLGYDTVIFDEAQDANPIMLRLLENQYKTGSKVIYLGDRHQAIYEFRGAVNAMELLPDSAVVLPLTQSWRFGPKTAAVANFLLNELKGESNQIEGMGKDLPYVDGKPVTYLSRTNADLLKRAVSIQGVGVEWVGGIDSYRVGSLNDVYALKKGRLDDISDGHLKRNFKSWDDFLEAGEVDAESKILADLITQYGDQVPMLVKTLRDNAEIAKATGEVTSTLATGHRSKGLEWDYVHIADDFKDVLSKAESYLEGKGLSFPEQEINLYYVLSTRARLGLKVNHEMNEWFDNIDAYRRKRRRTSEDVPLERSAKTVSRPGALVASPLSKAFSRIKSPMARSR